jgi:hypothetical protein
LKRKSIKRVGLLCLCFPLGEFKTSRLNDFPLWFPIGVDRWLDHVSVISKWHGKKWRSGSSSNLQRFCCWRKEETRNKKQRYAPRDHLHINNDCPKPPFIVNSKVYWGVPHQPIFFQLSIPGPPFSYVYHFMHISCSSTVGDGSARTQAFKEEVAFKFFFCPEVWALLLIRLHSHLSLRRWFPVQCQEVHESTLWERSSTGTLDEALPQSIYLAVGCRKVGSIKSLRGDLHECGIKDRRASIGFIDYIAVQEPAWPIWRERWVCPSLVPGSQNTTGLEDGSSELLRDELSYCGPQRIHWS